MNEQNWTRLLAQCVEDVTNRYAAEGYFPSASIHVFDREKTLCAVQFGDATDASWFDVASLTKIATATQILLLAESGALDLCAPVILYFSELQEDSFLRMRFEGITVIHLLTHTSTLPAWYPFYAHRELSFFEVLKKALQFEKPAEGVVYSDLNFILLGKLIERMRGKPLEQCLQEDLVRPLSLGDMTYRPGTALPVIPSSYGNDIEMDMCRSRGIAFDGFRPLDQPICGETNDGNAHYYFHGVSGHAGLFARPEAYERLCQFYMNTTLPLLMEAQREQPFSPTRGLGFQLGPSYPYGCGHTGFTGTGIWFSREKNVGVVSFTNRLFFRQRKPDCPIGDFRRALHECVLACVEARG